MCFLLISIIPQSKLDKTILSSSRTFSCTSSSEICRDKASRLKKQKYDRIMEKKMTTPTDLLCRGSLDNLRNFFNYCWAVRFADKPDGSYLSRHFRNPFTRKGYRYDYLAGVMPKATRHWPKEPPAIGPHTRHIPTTEGSLTSQIRQVDRIAVIPDIIRRIMNHPGGHPPSYRGLIIIPLISTTETLKLDHLTLGLAGRIWNQPPPLLKIWRDYQKVLT